MLSQCNYAKKVFDGDFTSKSDSIGMHEKLNNSA